MTRQRRKPKPVPRRVGSGVKHSSESFEHFTPPAVIERARRALGEIDLDPASSQVAQRVVRARNFYTQFEDGLEQEWHGKVLLNPPGGDLVRPVFGPDRPKSEAERARDMEVYRRWKTRSRPVAWWRKLMEEHAAGRCTGAVFIGFTVEMFQSTQGDAQWPSAAEFLCCLPGTRLAFWLLKGDELVEGKSPTHTNFIAYVGTDQVERARFLVEFRSLGIMVNEARW